MLSRCARGYLNSKYISKKRLGKKGLEKVLFDGSEGEKMLEKLGLTPRTIARLKWSLPVDVLDDDMKRRYSLQLNQKEPFKSFGFDKEDWGEKVVADRKFLGNEVIGFYVKRGTIHFSVLSTATIGTSAAVSNDD